LMGFLLTRPILHLRGDYLCIVTIAFGEVVRLALVNNLFGITGGANGLSGIDRPRLFGLELREPIYHYYIMLIFLVLTVVLVNRLEHSRLGRAWMYVREDLVAAEAMGIDTIKAKMLAFVIGSGWAGLVGALSSVYPGTTFTEMFCPDWKENVILLNHMGELNLNLAKWRPVLSDVKFNYNSCGNTAAAYGCMRPGKSVFINLAPMGEGFTLTLSPVEMLDAGLEFGAYRRSIQGWMKPKKPIAQFLKEFSLAGGTHHSALVYDVDVREIEAFGKMMGFETIVI